MHYKVTRNTATPRAGIPWQPGIGFLVRAIGGSGPIPPGIPAGPSGAACDRSRMWAGGSGAAGSCARRDRADRAGRHRENHDRHGAGQSRSTAISTSATTSRPRSSINRDARSSGTGQVLVAKKPFAGHRLDRSRVLPRRRSDLGRFPGAHARSEARQGARLRDAVSGDVRRRRQAGRKRPRKPGNSIPMSAATRELEAQGVRSRDNTGCPIG